MFKIIALLTVILQGGIALTESGQSKESFPTREACLEFTVQNRDRLLEIVGLEDAFESAYDIPDVVHVSVSGDCELVDVPA